MSVVGGPAGAYMLLSVAIIVKAVISQTGVPTTCQARVGDYDDGEFERVMRMLIPVMSDA